MEYIKDTLDFHITEPSVVTLGKFDGLHRGHGLLVRTVLDKSRNLGLKSVAFTFDILPRAKLLEEKAPVLTLNEEKAALFEHAGVDYLIECPFTEEVRGMKPTEFIAWIVKSLHIKCMVVGKDFRFGYQRAGDYRVLEEHAAEFGYEAIMVEKLQENGRDISSTYIREELLRGHIGQANRMLGYEYSVKSPVVQGEQLGRTIGIPTVNMILPDGKLLPMNGVYVTRVLCGGRQYRGVSNVGCKPTIAGTHPVGVETHILDFGGELYGRTVEIRFLEFLRPEQRFESLDALKQQMQADIAAARHFHGLQ